MLVDGGQGNNNPAEIAIIEAASIWPGVPINCVVSLGTGSKMATTNDFGSLGIVRSMIDACTSGDAVHRRMQFLSDWATGFKYYRFQTQNIDHVPLDCTDDAKLNGLLEATRAMIRDNAAELQEAAHTLLNYNPAVVGGGLSRGESRFWLFGLLRRFCNWGRPYAKAE